MALLRSIATVGGYTMASRILGFARDILIAALLGAGPVADAFFVAFKLPNFFRRLFAEGAFNAAFVPLFSGRLATEGQEAARAFAVTVLSVMVVFLYLFVTVLQIAMPLLMYGFAPGFADDPVKFDLAIELTRITFPYLLFISLVSLLGGILNSLGRFAAAAATPIILNIVLIAALVGATPYLPTPGHALAWGVAVAGMAQFVWLAIACHRAGMTLALPRPRLTPGVRRLLRLMLPGAVGAGVVQINLLIDIVIASLLPTGAVSFLYYADRVNQLPLGVVGIAIGTALLPLLSRQLREGSADAARDSMNRGIEFALLLTIPGASALLVIAEPIITVLFQRGAFDGAISTATAQALMAYAVGLPAYVLIKVLGPGFFAREDTKTPVKIAIICVAVNVVLNLTLIHWLAHVGIALATALSAWLNAVLLIWTLRRRGHHALDARVRSRTLRILVASAGMAAVLWFMMFWGGDLFTGAAPVRIAALAVLIGVGLLVYAGLAIATGAANLADLRGFLKRGSPPPTLDQQP
ncbi:MAG: murein biosynthesis integral membrane protein MurJ [Rhodospirillaceae bacterium]|jgi:putative peptidoglycan lipid II flippase|nr:murein biosynthesis integral membrane protein MurJ [Rhodospirillaceae bacterium]MBT5459334.1 murein biosynthesis integral membrane protein MurJ [Rhodospirillaceae bacterium]